MGPRAIYIEVKCGQKNFTISCNAYFLVDKDGVLALRIFSRPKLRKSSQCFQRKNLRVYFGLVYPGPAFLCIARVHLLRGKPIFFNMGENHPYLILGK